MSSTTHDWLLSASALQKQTNRLLAAPPRRRTMIEALLKQSSTFARLGCLLAARANNTDSRLDYEAVEDDFTDATQDFQSTLQEVLGWTDSDAVKLEPVSQELGLFEEDTAVELAGLGTDMERSEEGDVGEFEMESMGSQRSEVPDPLEDMYAHMSTCLLRDLQEPLLSQLQDPLTESLCAPLLAELADPLGSRIVEDICASQEHIDAIAASLSENPSLLQALADKLHPQLVGKPAVPVAHLGHGHLVATSVESMPAATTPLRPQRALPSPTTMRASLHALVKREPSPTSVQSTKKSRHGAME